MHSFALPSGQRRQGITVLKLDAVLQRVFLLFFLTNFTFVCDTWAVACLSFPFNNPVFEIGSSSKEGGCLRRAMALPQLESPFDAGKK
ncbi:hypothetical protein FOCG_18525 [Fusarium oxysporum f. sp. radicis-lycopersici 26381]|nr:hypothetical protein FOCG_18525 [Fusarium oxysporum f. sp. radicis-lycopersici 26381]